MNTHTRTDTDSGSSSGSKGSYGDITIEQDHVVKHARSDLSFPYSVREMSALKLLQKAQIPNIVKLLGINDDGALLLEKFDGDLLDTCKLESTVVMNIVHKILLVMHHMHLLNICHRDIKPDNILSSHDGSQIALCDFGLSRYFPEGQTPEQTTAIVQTSHYRAPELVFKSLENADIGPVKHSNLDIWSLGVTVLHLLDMEDFYPPEPYDIDENKLLMDTHYELYVQMYGQNGLLAEHVETNQYENGPCMTEFLRLICSMLTLNSNNRPDAGTLLSSRVFDNYPSVAIDVKEFMQKRTSFLMSIIPETESNQSLRDMHYNISYSNYLFNNIESQRLAHCIVYLIPENERSNIDVMTIIGLAVVIFDSDIIDFTKSDILALMKLLDYDLMLPVNDAGVIQRLDKLLSTV